MRHHKPLALALLPLLAACAAPAAQSPASRPVASAPLPQNPQVQPDTRFRPARVMDIPGLEGVIGLDAAGLVRQFGQPRLDIWEDDARKLQFTGSACTLDIYLYPPAPRSEERATYVDARRSDGQEVDRAACVRALRR